MLKKLLLPVLFVTFFVSQALAQAGNVTGMVTNEEGDPVPTANVLLVELNRGDATNLEGEYTIENVPPGTYTLRISFVGYRNFTTQVTIEAGQTVTQNVTLQRGAVGLKELVVTGFGTESKIEYTGSASTVNVNQQIDNVPVANIGAALQGSVTGLNVTGFSGTPGSPVEFNIRGVASINAGGSPLVVLDGVPIANSSPQLGDNTEMGILASIPPSAIQSVTVLKGPVATAQYGAQGANGVIVIKTKRGTPGETRYSISYQRGTVSRAVPFPEMLTAQQHAVLYREAKINADKLKGNDPVPAPSEIPIPGWNGETNTDWVDIVTRDNATTQNFNISASGGTQEATYFGSLSYKTAESVVISSGYERIAGTFNFSYDFNDNIEISNQFIGSFSTLKGVDEGGSSFDSPLAAPVFLSSLYRVRDKDGSINFDLPAQYNPLWIAKWDINRSRTYRLVNSVKLNIDFTDNLTFSTEAGVDYTVLTEKHFANPVHSGAAAQGGSAQEVYNRTFVGTLQNSFNYRYAINEDNTFEAALINTLTLYKLQQIAAEANGFATKRLTNLASASTPVTAYSFNNDGSLISILAKVHYSYKDKIFIDATIRREGNSRFAQGHRWGTFYGVGAAWLISSEDFLSNADWLDLLKVRTSYGVTGNNAIGRNEFQSFLGYSAAYANAPGSTPAQLGNELLTWEKQRSFEVGLRFGLFNRIDANITAFRNKTYDLLYSVPLSLTSGFSSQIRNVGELRGKGIEVSLGIDVIRTDDFLFRISGDFTYVTNEIIALPTNDEGNAIKFLGPRGLKYVAALGRPVGSWYMRTWAGVDPQTGRALWEVNDNDGNPGELTSTWLKANPEFQGATPFPTHYGSIGFRTNYKGFYASASLYGSFGNKIYDGWAEYYHSDGQYPYPGFATMAVQLKRWQEPGDITNVPIRIRGSRDSNNRSSRFLYNGDYLRLQTVRLGYNVPATLLEDLNVGVNGLNIYMVARNLWTYKFDETLPWDPAVGTSGGANDAGFLSLWNQSQQAFTIGINVQF